MDWNDVRYFLALARLGSVRAAGAALGVSHSTVARRVEALETQLATRLFDRQRDGYVLTDAGAQLLPGAERVEGEMLALERGLTGQDERLAGSVSITCCDHYVAGLLIGELRSFCAEHPDIELCLSTDSRVFDLSKREADIAIRIVAAGELPPSHLIGQKLAPLVVANYVASAHAADLMPNQCEGSRWVSFEPRQMHETMVAASSYPDVACWGAFSSLALIVQAASAGYGLAMLPTYAGDNEPLLQRLPEPDLRHVADLWLLSHPDLRDNARFKATRAAVTGVFTRRIALFEGDAVEVADAAKPGEAL